MRGGNQRSQNLDRTVDMFLGALETTRTVVAHVQRIRQVFFGDGYVQILRTENVLTDLERLLVKADTDRD